VYFSTTKRQQYALYMVTQISSMAKAFDNVTNKVVRAQLFSMTYKAEIASFPKQKVVLQIPISTLVKQKHF
jgi:adenosine deaminase